MVASGCTSNDSNDTAGPITLDHDENNIPTDASISNLNTIINADFDFEEDNHPPIICTHGQQPIN